jgi:hypothetical protein
MWTAEGLEPGARTKAGEPIVSIDTLLLDSSPFWSRSRSRSAERTLSGLFARLSREDRGSVVRCAGRLQDTLPEPVLDRNRVLVAYGGGKDSSYSLAFVRAMQLVLLRDHGTTFNLRVATNRHAGMPRAVMENVDRVYTALGLYSDPLCELLLVDGDEVTEFDVDTPQRAEVLARNRLDVLLTGHRTCADARPTFCNACNLSMVNAFGVAAAFGTGVHVIVTGDSPQEQRAYLLWVKRLARRIGSRPRAGTGNGFAGFLQSANDIARAYFTDIHGAAATEAIADRRIATGVPSGLQFFSIYDETCYSSGDHWELLTDFLGFEFDDLAFSFTESDCANPALMAHLRGLKCERLFGRSYDEGLAEYVEFAVRLMRRKEFPEVLIQKMIERYRSQGAGRALRDAVNRFAAEAYRLTEEQLICMVYSPFTEKGRRLDRYVQRELPGLADHLDELHELLRDGSSGDRSTLRAELERVSGLPLAQLRMLYRKPLRVGRSGQGETSIIGAILDGDPHKDVIQTRHAPDGPVVPELISGR